MSGCSKRHQSASAAVPPRGDSRRCTHRAKGEQQDRRRAMLRGFSHETLNPMVRLKHLPVEADFIFV